MKTRRPLFLCSIYFHENFNSEKELFNENFYSRKMLRKINFSTVEKLCNSLAGDSNAGTAYSHPRSLAYSVSTSDSSCPAAIVGNNEICFLTFFAPLSRPHDAFLPPSLSAHPLASVLRIMSTTFFPVFTP